VPKGRSRQRLEELRSSNLELDRRNTELELQSAAAVLTALLPFLKPAERATAHKASSDRYLGLRNQARVLREIKLAHVTAATQYGL
jgi:hypothetical protein